MRVLRVESFKDKIGPYRVKGIPQLKDNVSTNRHPTPCEDMVLREWWDTVRWVDERKEWFFGFRDHDQLFEWWPKNEWQVFYEYNRGLNSDDAFGISEYEVDYSNMHFGTHQITFRLHEATRVHFEPFIKPSLVRRALNTIMA